MASRVRRHLIGALAATLIIAGCGGASPVGSGSAPAAQTDAPPAPGVSAAPAASAAVPEVNILTDFGDVCRSVRLAGATAYDPGRAGVHPLVTMSGEAPAYATAGSGLPDQWDPAVGQEQTVELVACLERVSSTVSQTCTGYKDNDDQDTGNTVEVYDVTYDVRLIAATTGEVVAQTQLEATGASCPMLVFFTEGETVKPWYAEPSDALTAWLAPYVET
jgi:hypothetical protein